MEKSSGNEIINWRKLADRLDKLSKDTTGTARLVVTYASRGGSYMHVWISTRGLVLPRGRECSALIFVAETELEVWASAKNFYLSLKKGNKNVKRNRSKRID